MTFNNIDKYLHSIHKTDKYYEDLYNNSHISYNLEYKNDNILSKLSYTEKIKKWKVNNWRSSNKKPVKNKDLWVDLDEAVGLRKINWQWVKGHAGNEGNEKADELANQGVISMMR